MPEPYLGEIRLMGFPRPPKGWAFCDGSSLPVNQNQALFALLGTRYGGDGHSNFRVPDLRGRVPVNLSKNNEIGERGGVAAHTLSTVEMPAHSHTIQATSNAGGSNDPEGKLFAAIDDQSIYTGGSADLPMGDGMVTEVGQGEPHSNMQPYLALNFCIALVGIYPSRP
ncbi:tail fiber protein [Gammaproteobacteria bacterium AB-CW1]|uniref:Tail fiber protein n=1 Tax=Natronospira elongata TaxID=3110268 RepID=A0AAP6JG45_9GAMM|nr:tail fiber protein [Gammaproteobacteria bacterium AB-CW1]